MTDEPDTPATVGRRRWLSVLSASLSLGVAGCLGDGEDDGPSDDGTVDGDDSSGGPDDTDTEDDPGDTGDDSTDDTGGGDDSDDDTGGGNGSDDNGSDGGDESTQPDVPITLTDLRAAQVPITVSLGVDESAPIAVTVANDGDTAAEIPVTFAVLAGQDGVDESPNGSPGQSISTDDALASQTLTVTLDPGASERLTASGLTDGLEQGSYTVTAAAGDQQATLGLELFADSPVPITVYTQAVSEEYRADSGQVTVSANDQPVATASLDSQPVTVALPLEQIRQYAIEVENLDGGAWPDTQESIVVNSGADPSIEFVAGYELPDAVGFQFSSYRLMSREERIGFGLYSSEGDYQFSFTDSLTSTPNSPYLEPDGTPPEYSADLGAIAEQVGGTPVSHALQKRIPGDSAGYYYAGSREHWEPLSVESATERYRRVHNFGLSLASADTADELHREHERRDSVRDTPVDVYRVPEIGTSVFVDPETGHTLRAVRQSGGTYEIVDFFAHGDIEGIDWELLKERSIHETGENLEGEELERLPWEIHQGD